MADMLPGDHGRFHARCCRELAATAPACCVTDVVDQVQAPGTGKGFDHIDGRHPICAVTQIETAQLTVTGDQKNDVVLFIDHRSIVHSVRTQPSGWPEGRSGIGEGLLPEDFSRICVQCEHRVVGAKQEDQILRALRSRSRLPPPAAR